jgi:hypothetical protein
VSINDAGGLHYVLGHNGNEAEDDPAGRDNQSIAATVLAPIAPGVVPAVPIARWRRLAEGERIEVERRHSSIALDGERAFTVTPEQQVEISVQRNGPPVVQVERALTLAAEHGLFRW